MRQQERKRAVEVAGPEAHATTESVATEPADADQPASAPEPPAADAAATTKPEKPTPSKKSEASVGPPIVAPDRLAAALEAVLLTSDRPVTAARLSEALRLAPLPSEAGKDVPPARQVEAAIDALNADYERTRRSFRIEKVAGGVRVMTLPEFAPAVAAFQAERTQSRLSRAAVETLAIIAYRQPITRAELEAIRGVACGEVVKTLLERRLVEITGRAEELGRPLLYGTTRRFLEQFGLASLKDLPAVGDLAARHQD